MRTGSYIDALRQANLVVHADLGGRLYCEDRETPHQAHELRGDVIVTCPICFGPRSRVPGSARLITERVR